MKKSKAKFSSATSDGAKAKKLVLSSIFGAIVGILIFFLLLVVLSAVTAAIPSPHKIFLPLSFFAIYSSAFLAGLFAVKRNSSSNALACGSLCGALFLILLWCLLSLVPSESSASFAFKLLILPASILGAFAGTSSKSKKPKRKF